MAIDKFLNSGKAYIRNPLGVIGLFIALIYGTAALLIGVTAASLPEGQTWFLVAFVVLFPFSVLGVFTYLVVHHHEKLYAPGDFQSDEGFWRKMDASRVGERLREDSAQISEGSDRSTEVDTYAGKGSDEAAVQNQAVASRAHDDIAKHNVATSPRSRQIQELFLAESLAIAELERMLRVTFSRNVRKSIGDRTYEFDGVADVANVIHVAEVRALRDAPIGSLKRIDFADRLRRVEAAVLEVAAGKRVELILAIVSKRKLMDESKRRRELCDWLKENGLHKFQVMVFNFDDLLGKYGLINSSDEARS